jgi:hypothetical protein
MGSSHSSIYDTAFGTSGDFWEDSSPTNLLDRSGLPMMVVCSSQSTEDSCTKANAFAQAAQSVGVKITVSTQTLAPGAISSQLGVSSSYTSSVDSYIQSIL